MTTNERYGDKLVELKRKQKELEVEIYKCKEENQNLHWSVENYKDDAKRTNLCLFFSMFLTITIIVLMVLLITNATSDDITSVSLIGGIGAIYVINYVIMCIAQEEFSAFLLLGLIPPLFFIAPFVAMYNIIVECKDNISYLNSKKSLLNNNKSLVRKKEKELDDTKYDISVIEEYIANANSLYNRAIGANDLQLMKEAANEGNADAIKYLKNIADKERLEKAEELYKQAKSGNETDKVILKQAANLGHEKACLELGKELYFESISDYYTNEEKLEKAKEAEKYLRVFENSSNIEGKFLNISLFVMSGDTDYSKWEKALAQLREIKNSGSLPSNYNQALDIAIKGAVQMIDAIKGELNTSYNYSSVHVSTYNNDYDPHYAGTFLDSREKVKSIIADPNVSEQEKQRVAEEHNRWHLDNYDFGV